MTTEFEGDARGCSEGSSKRVLESTDTRPMAKASHREPAKNGVNKQHASSPAVNGWPICHAGKPRERGSTESHPDWVFGRNTDASPSKVCSLSSRRLAGPNDRCTVTLAIDCHN